MITSGSPTEQLEICVSGAYFRGIWFPEYGGHVTDRHKDDPRKGNQIRLRDTGPADDDGAIVKTGQHPAAPAGRRPSSQSR